MDVRALFYLDNNHERMQVLPQETPGEWIKSIYRSPKDGSVYIQYTRPTERPLPVLGDRLHLVSFASTDIVTAATLYLKWPR
jgi:hypothetical protein